MAKEETKIGSSMNVPVVVLIGAALVIGYLLARVQLLEKKGTTPGTTKETTDTAQAPDQQAPERPTSLDIVKPDPKKDHWKGLKDAQFVLVEYSDLECPFCQRFHPTPPKILEEFEGKVAYAWRHFPLAFHSKANKSAEATECAADLGGEDGFWNMVDTIFERMPTMELTDLPAIASEIGLDQSKFKKCLDSGKHAQKVKDQLDEGSQAGVAATPTSVIYNMKTGETTVVEGALPFEQVKSAVEDFMDQG